MPGTTRRRSRRGGFALIEIFVAGVIFLVAGLLISLAVRWLFRADHWITWLPAVILGIPFAFVYGLIVPTIIGGHIVDWWRKPQTRKRRTLD